MLRGVIAHTIVEVSHLFLELGFLPLELVDLFAPGVALARLVDEELGELPLRRRC